MSKFHTFLKNESSSDSEDGELNETNDEMETKQELPDSNDPKSDTITLNPSKSLQIVDRIGTKRNNRFSIWSDLLLEEELNHSVNNSLDIKKRRSKTRKLDRNCENYSFWTKKQLETNSDQQLTQNSDNPTAIERKKKNKKKKKSDRNKPKAQTDGIAIEMAKKLNEPKVDLLRKVSQTIGEQKSMELLSATLEIETAGGLMTVDGKRRRTAGGVFFQLLKNDANIPKESIELIFSDEQKYFKQKKLKKRPKRKDNKKFNKNTFPKNKPNDESNGDQIHIENQTIIIESQTMDQ